MLHPRLRPAFLCAPLLLALAPLSDELAFHPKADAQVERKLAIELEVGLDDFTLSVNGQDVGSEGVEGLDDLKALVHVAMTTTDTYVKSADGKPLELTRTFDDLSLKTEAGDESNEDADVDAFEGKTARFRWNEEKKDYAKSWTEPGPDEKALEGLHPDMDVACLLPSGKVEEGDTWEVKGEELVGLFFPGGLFPSKADDANASAGLEAEKLLAQLEEKMKAFTVTCTYKGAHEEGKDQVGEIAFHYDGSVDLDLGELIADAISGSGGEDVPDFEMKTAMKMKGEGTVDWLLGAGRLHAMKMKSELGLTIDAKASMEQQGQSLDIEAHFSASGTGDWDLSVK